MAYQPFDYTVLGTATLQPHSLHFQQYGEGASSNCLHTCSSVLMVQEQEATMVLKSEEFQEAKEEKVQEGTWKTSKALLKSKVVHLKSMSRSLLMRFECTILLFSSAFEVVEVLAREPQHHC